MGDAFGAEISVRPKLSNSAELVQLLWNQHSQAASERRIGSQGGSLRSIDTYPAQYSLSLEPSKRLHQSILGYITVDCCQQPISLLYNPLRAVQGGTPWRESAALANSCASSLNF
eukprot:m.130019 g.130019  ORF g.130019 m.130019 type:complete len:115 (-) comp13696_c0_seq1:3789-4133(-)